MYVGRVEKLLAHYSQIPLCFVNLNGKITRASSKIAEVFKYDGIIGRDIFELTRIRPAELIEAAQNETNLYLDSNDKSFKILSEFIGEGETASIMMSFIDVTSYEVLKDMYNDEKACIAVINVDNFDELTASAGDERELAISTEIDRLIRGWGEKLGAAVVRYREHLYEICLTHGNLQRLVDDKFCILDEAKEIETEADFPVTLSIGSGHRRQDAGETVKPTRKTPWIWHWDAEAIRLSSRTSRTSNIMGANPRAWRRAIRENPGSSLTR